VDRVAFLLTARIGPPVFVAVGLSALALCVHSQSELGLIVKFFLGRLAYSTSNAAALFTLGFALALLVWPGHLVRAEFWRRTFALSLAAGYGAHLALLAVLTVRYGLNDFDFAIFWAHGENSFNALTHSHVGKVGLAMLAALSGGAPGYDTGFVFLDEVPHAVSYLLALNFIICIVAAVGWTQAMLRAYAGRPALQWALALAALSAVKSQLDGGLLSGAGLAALGVVGVFLRYPARRVAERFWRRSGIAYVLTVGGIYLAAAAVLLPSMPPLPPLLGPVALYGWLLVTALHGPRRIGAIAFAAYLALHTWTEIETELAPLLKPMPSQASVWHIDAAGMQAESLEVSGFDGLRLFEVYRRLGNDPLKPNSVLIALPGMQGSGRLEVAIGAESRLPSEGRILPPSAGWQFASVGAAAGSRLHLAMVLNIHGLPPMQAIGTGTVVTRNNFQVYLHWLARRLTGAGWQRYLLGLRSSS